MALNAHQVGLKVMLRGVGGWRHAGMHIVCVCRVVVTRREGAWNEGVTSRRAASRALGVPGPLIIYGVRAVF